MASFLHNLGARLGIGDGAGASTKLPPGNGQWARLANFFPDNGTGTKMDGKGQHVDIESILSGLQGLTGGSQSPPPQSPPIQFAPMPQSRFLPDLQNAPQLGRRASPIPPPPQMAPYLWGGR